ncbi:protein heterodimerization protein [Malassezia pachydermatis]
MSATEETIRPVTERMEENPVPVPQDTPTDQSTPMSTEPTTEPSTTLTRRVSRPVAPPQKGTSVFPMARADSSVDICSKEATFLISVATELFVKKFAEEGCNNARLDKRKMIRYDDMAKAVSQNEYLDFLREVVPTAIPLSVAMKQREERANMEANGGEEEKEEEADEAEEPEEPEDTEEADESMADSTLLDKDASPSLNEHMDMVNDGLGDDPMQEEESS